jgi:hypothetical protein
MKPVDVGLVLLVDGEIDRDPDATPSQIAQRLQVGVNDVRCARQLLIFHDWPAPAELQEDLPLVAGAAPRGGR